MTTGCEASFFGYFRARILLTTRESSYMKCPGFARGGGEGGQALAAGIDLHITATHDVQTNTSKRRQTPIFAQTLVLVHIYTSHTQSNVMHACAYQKEGIFLTDNTTCVYTRVRDDTHTHQQNTVLC